MSPETQQAWPAPAVGNAPVGTQERFGSGLAGNRRSTSDRPEASQPNGTAYEPPLDKPRLPSLDLEAPAEPDFSDSWLDRPSGSLVDHPLLRGLLLELPPKGSTPPPGWLDRWFEATRSILELLYVQDGARR
jgi:hypothetical protein